MDDIYIYIYIYMYMGACKVGYINQINYSAKNSYLAQATGYRLKYPARINICGEAPQAQRSCMGVTRESTEHTQ